MPNLFTEKRLDTSAKLNSWMMKLVKQIISADTVKIMDGQAFFITVAPHSKDFSITAQLLCHGKW